MENIFSELNKVDDESALKDYSDDDKMEIHCEDKENSSRQDCML